MRMKSVAGFLLCIGWTAALASPAPAVDPEIEKLQSVVQKLEAQVNSLQQTVQAQQTTIEALRAQVDALSHQQQAQSEVPRTAAGVARIRTGTAGAWPAAADALYKAALEDFNAHRNGTATKEFGKLLKDYGGFDQAGDAQFYLGEIEYRQGHYQTAILAYDKAFDQYPGCDKVAASRLKKAFALLELEQRDAGVQELRSLIARYPQSPEAVQAKEKLADLGL